MPKRRAEPTSLLPPAFDSRGFDASAAKNKFYAPTAYVDFALGDFSMESAFEAVSDTSSSCASFPQSFPASGIGLSLFATQTGGLARRQGLLVRGNCRFSAPKEGLGCMGVNADGAIIL